MRLVTGVLVIIVATSVTCAAQPVQYFRPIAELAPLTTQELIKELDSPVYDTAINAAALLGARGELAAAAVPRLTRAVTDEQSLIGEAALEALAAIGRPALSSLLYVLATYPTVVRFFGIAENGVIAMGRDVVPDLLEAIVARAKEPTSDAEIARLDLRAGLARVFETFGLNALPPLIGALDNPDPWVRGEAAYWTVRVGRAAPAVPALKAALARTPEPHRSLIQKALDKIR